MRHRRTPMLLVIFALIRSATVAVSSQAPTLAITNVNVVDVSNGRVVPHSTVVVAGNTITSVTQNGTAPRDARQPLAQAKAAAQR